jgi:hypothetical protein
MLLGSAGDVLCFAQIKQQDWFNKTQVAMLEQSHSPPDSRSRQARSSRYTDRDSMCHCRYPFVLSDAPGLHAGQNLDIQGSGPLSLHEHRRYMGWRRHWSAMHTQTSCLQTTRRDIATDVVKHQKSTTVLTLQITMIEE